MSPKKHHEISRFLDYLSYLDLGIGHDVRHAIDLGAGRGYLSRALADRILGLDVLAVDCKDELTQDARGLLLRTTMPERKHEERRGKLEHVTAFLDCDSVLALLEDWNGDRDKLLVALHACGDLTVEVLRAIIADTLRSTGRRNSLICVGCCYNRMDPSKSMPCESCLRYGPFRPKRSS
jgi:trans-aconitate methyltransferase